MSCRLYLIRHGETEWNNTMKFQGSTDIPLSENGRRQSERLGKRLASLKLDAVYTSDLLRAYETATIINSHHNVPLEIVPGLREINFGAWEGLTIAEIKKLFADEITQWWKNPFSIRLPGGETYFELVERSVKAAKNIVARHNDGQVLLVSHGGPIKSIVCSILGIDLSSYWKLGLHNGSLSIIEFTGWDYGILTLFNDCSHLTDNK
jgi:alpha-ribazole phosphatase